MFILVLDHHRIFILLNFPPHFSCASIKSKYYKYLMLKHVQKYINDYIVINGVIINNIFIFFTFKSDFF